VDPTRTRPTPAPARVRLVWLGGTPRAKERRIHPLDPVERCDARLPGYTQAHGYGVTELLPDQDGICAGLGMTAIADRARAKTGLSAPLEQAEKLVAR
jgi:hypothetical protein